MCVFFKDGRSGGGGGRGSSSWSRRGSGVGVGSGSGLGAPSASARVLCVPAAVRREPLHDRVRCLQGLVPRQVNKPPQPRRRRPRPPASLLRRRLCLPRAGPPLHAPRPETRALSPQAGRRRERGAPACRAGCGAEPVDSAGPGEESPQQTGTKGPAEKLAGEARARGPGGRRGSGDGGAQAGPQLIAPHCPGCRRAQCPGLPPPRACPRRPSPRLLSFRAAAARSGAGPVAPPSLFIKLPRATGRGGGTTARGGE